MLNVGRVERRSIVIRSVKVRPRLYVVILSRCSRFEHYCVTNGEQTPYAA